MNSLYFIYYILRVFNHYFKEKLLERGNDIVITVKIKILFFIWNMTNIYIYLLSNIVCLL